MPVDGPSQAFKRHGRIVIVGASLAGPAGRGDPARGGLHRVADHDRRRALRALRPAAAVQAGPDRAGCRRTTPRCPGAARSTPSGGSGSPATGLDLAAKRVRLADGEEVGFDRLLIATGTRARPWPNEAEAALDGVFVAAHPRRRDRGCSGGWPPGPGGCWSSAPGSPAPRSPPPAGSGPGGDRGRARRRPAGRARSAASIGAVAAEHAARARRRPALRRHGHRAGGRRGGRLRARPSVRRHHARRRRGGGRARRASATPSGCAGSGLAAGPRGIACDAGCRAFDVNGIVTDDVFVAGDVAALPAPALRLPVPRRWSTGATRSRRPRSRRTT